MDTKELLEQVRSNFDYQEKRVTELEAYCKFLEQLLAKNNISFVKVVFI